MAMTEENQKFLCSILSYPQNKKQKKKKHAFISWPLHLHFPFWHCLTSHKRNGDKCNRSICWLQNSHIEKDKVCYASIHKYNRCLATCTSTVSVCCKRKKIKNIFFFFFWYRDHPQNRMLPKSPANKAATAPWKESPLPWTGIHTIWH